MRRIVRGQQADLIELQRRASGFGGVEVAEVNRIERAAEHPDPARGRHASRRVRDGVIRSIPSESGGAPVPPRRLLARATGNLAPCRLHQLLEVRRPRTPEIGMIGSLRCAHVSRQALERVGIVERIDLVRRDDLRFGGELRIEEPQLFLDRVEVLDRIPSGRSRDIDQVHQHLGALDVAEEAIAEPMALVRALDQPGHVGDDEAAIVAQAHDAQVRRERRERIVGDLGTGRRDPRDQRGLSGVGEPDQPDVGQQLQLEAEELLFATPAGLGAPRCAVGGAHEPRVPAPSASAPRDQDTLALFGEIREQTQMSPSLFSYTSVPMGTVTSRS